MRSNGGGTHLGGEGDATSGGPVFYLVVAPLTIAALAGVVVLLAWLWGALVGAGVPAIAVVVLFTALVGGLLYAGVSLSERVR